MRFGITITTGDPRWIADQAARAEAAGWDGVFYWDVIDLPSLPEIHDPWVVLAAIAMRTDRVTIGAMVTPVPRRRPWKLAREAISVDHLSGGRLVLPVGIGDPRSFGRVGEQTDRQQRAAMLDEGLEVLSGLQSGMPFSFSGSHYQVEGLAVQPRSLQSPRIPIWVVGLWPRPRSIARAVRYEGLIPIALGAEGDHAVLTPALLHDLCADVRMRRAQAARSGPFEIIVEGVSGDRGPLDAGEIVRPWADAGATWWIETDWSNVARDAVAARIEAGPPRVM